LNSFGFLKIDGGCVKKSGDDFAGALPAKTGLGFYIIEII
jgi:hypothetical protein